MTSLLVSGASPELYKRSGSCSRMLVLLFVFVELQLGSSRHRVRTRNIH